MLLQGCAGVTTIDRPQFDQILSSPPRHPDGIDEIWYTGSENGFDHVEVDHWIHQGDGLQVFAGQDLYKIPKAQSDLALRFPLTDDRSRWIDLRPTQFAPISLPRRHPTTVP